MSEERTTCELFGNGGGGNHFWPRNKDRIEPGGAVCYCGYITLGVGGGYIKDGTVHFERRASPLRSGRER